MKTIVLFSRPQKNLKKKNLDKIKFKPIKDLNKLYKLVGENIKYYRKSAGLTIAELATLCQIKPSYLGNIERGERKTTLHVLQKIVHKLHIYTSDLFINKKIKKTRKEILVDTILAYIKDKPLTKINKIFSIIKKI